METHCRWHPERKNPPQKTKDVSTVIVPEASAGQATAASSPAGVFLHTASPVFCSAQISWGSKNMGTNTGVNNRFIVFFFFYSFRVTNQGISFHCSASAPPFLQGRVHHRRMALRRFSVSAEFHLHMFYCSCPKNSMHASVHQLNRDRIWHHEL